MAITWDQFFTGIFKGLSVQSPWVGPVPQGYPWTETDGVNDGPRP